MGREKQQYDFDLLKNEYLIIKPITNSLRFEIKNQIDILLDKSDIPIIFPIEHRVKTWDSIETKLTREQLKIGSLKDIQDLIGLRIVVPFKDDVEKIKTAISEVFSIVRSYSTQKRLNVDQFGYSSVHLIIEVPKGWIKIPSFSDSEGIIAEIQIRTLTQHLWAYTSRKYFYNNEANIPPDITRSFFSVSAQLETIDDQLSTIVNEARKSKPIVSLEKITVSQIQNVLNRNFPNNKRENESYDDIQLLLENNRILTISEVNKLIGQYKKIVIKEDRNRAKNIQNELDANIKHPEDVREGIKKSVFYSQKGIVSRMLYYYSRKSKG